MQEGNVNWAVAVLIVLLMGATVWAISQSAREAPPIK
jgi:hypothetical protein